MLVIKNSCIDTYRRAKEIEQLRQATIKAIEQKSSTRSLPTKLKALELLFTDPVISITQLSEKLGVSYNTAHNIIIDFVTLGILIELTEQKRYKLFSFKQYLAILEQSYDEE